MNFDKLYSEVYVFFFYINANNIDHRIFDYEKSRVTLRRFKFLSHVVILIIFIFSPTFRRHH